MTTDVIIGFGVAGGALVILMLCLGVRQWRRKRRAKERARLRAEGVKLPPRKPRKPSLWRRMVGKKPPRRRPAVHIPKPSDDAVLKQPLTAHTRNNQSIDSTASPPKTSLDSAFAGPRLTIDPSWRGRLQAVQLPAPSPPPPNKLRKSKSSSRRSRDAREPPLTTGEKPRDVRPTLPSVAPDPLPLPSPGPGRHLGGQFVTTAFDAAALAPSYASTEKPPLPLPLPLPSTPAPALAATRGPTPEFDPLAHRSHMHRFSQLLSPAAAAAAGPGPAQRLSFVFDELTRRAVLVPFEPTLPDELRVRVGEELAVLECFDDGWSVVQRPRAVAPPAPAAARPAGPGPAAPGTAAEAWEDGDGEVEVEQGVVPTVCWAGAPSERVESVPMRYSSLRHGVEAGLFEIGTAL
ncbi:hypothetical protein CALCODRAFT_500835 [Calocera cornea HHB12733]|uniref:SH3 domain-containing protein n=1 Tax=Calocera cornea HHB12733 TaxID=1353952 RepID=A0A165DWH9_9BASI|nr:hypothetical protein CALCODRAFT_500835 [Calocera cornea HHB12733]